MKRMVPLQQAHRMLAARPVCLVTTMLKGRVNVMPLAWHCPVSIDPPLVAIAVHPTSYTHELLRQHEECVLNIPGRPMLEAVLACGSVSGRTEDKVDKLGLALESGQGIDAPWIEGCLAHLECVVVDRLQPGDHMLYILRVVGAWAEEEAFTQVWVTPAVAEELAPLVHLGGAVFASLSPLSKAEVSV
ncbi:MAG: flavin reductase family protein [Anaerolineales bacterium]